MVELCLKVVAYGLILNTGAYLRISKWHVLDFVCVLGSVASWVPGCEPPSSSLPRSFLLWGIRLGVWTRSPAQSTLLARAVPGVSATGDIPRPIDCQHHTRSHPSISCHSTLTECMSNRCRLEGGSTIKLLRAFRVFRPLTMVNKLPRLQLLAQTLGAAVEQMRDIFIVMGVFIIFMATIGLQAFQVSTPY